MQKFSKIVKTTNGENVLTSEYIDSLRQESSKYNFIAQQGGQENMLLSYSKIKIGGGSRGGSKGSPYSEDIITPFGVRKMGDLKIGDTISSVKGGMQKVVCITELGAREVFKVNFSDGTSVRCTSDHLWKIKQSCRIHKSRKINNSGQDDDWRLWTFDMIKSFLDRQESGELSVGKSKSNLLIPLCDEVKFTRSFAGWYKPKTNPYAIGVILGDGSITNASIDSNKISISFCDFEIIDYLKEMGITPCYSYKNKTGKCIECKFNDATIIDDLRGLKLSGKYSNEKFIPNIYKYGTIETRLAVVQGIMDTYGTIDSRGRCSFTSTSKQMADDMAFILRSLGAYVTHSIVKDGYKNASGEYHECSDAHILYIKAKNTERFFRLPRKRDKCKRYNGGISEPAKRIVGYEFVGYDKCRCIAVSDVSALYLTTDFNVTHNSFSLLMEALYDITNPNFNATIMRNERNDLQNIINESYNLYSDFGSYNKSLTDMTWNFRFGGRLKFDYYNDPSFEEFKKRFQGKQFCYIGIDEITQMPYDRFKYITTDNRNAYGIPNRIFGTCNPDPDCWVRPFIDWWIGEDGFPIPERDSIERFCFMNGDSPSSIIWGGSPDEVYDQCHSIIDDLWKPEYENVGLNKKTAFIQSVTFVKSSLEDNKKLLLSDPTYLANLAQQSEEQRERDLKGNWNFKTSGDDMIKMSDLETMFGNPEMVTDNIHYASCDLAFAGGDNLVLWHWIGYHIVDLFVCRNDARTAIIMVKQKLAEWNVDEKHFTYDLNGIGQTFKGFFPDAVPFNNMAAPLAYSVNGTKYDEASVKSMYANLKSQCAFLFVGLIKKEMVSISEDLLDLKFSGDGFEKMPLRNILQMERKCIRKNDDKADSSFALINKKTMKKYVGHSPDFFEGLIYRMIFDINKKRNKTPKGLWMI